MSTEEHDSRRGEFINESKCLRGGKVRNRDRVLKNVSLFFLDIGLVSGSRPNKYIKCRSGMKAEAPQSMYVYVVYVGFVPLYGSLN